MVELLPSMDEAMGLILSTERKKERECPESYLVANTKPQLFYEEVGLTNLANPLGSRSIKHNELQCPEPDVKEHW